jgi:DNA-binding TFAR19-related protein (PDSD5 family)
MKHELIESTVRDWVMGNPARGARELERLANVRLFRQADSAEEIANALIQLAGRMEIAESRAW